jgi:hypothetical protein
MQILLFWRNGKTKKVVAVAVVFADGKGELL